MTKFCWKLSKKKLRYKIVISTILIVPVDCLLTPAISESDSSTLEKASPSHELFVPFFLCSNPSLYVFTLSNSKNQIAGRVHKR